MNETKKNPLKIGIIGLCLLLVGGVAGYFISYYANKLSKDEQKIVDEYRVLKDEWLYEDDDTFSELAANGLANAIANTHDDPYTFYTPDSASQGLNTDGSGFGIEVHPYDGGFYVVNVFTDSAAYKAGLKRGDVLVSADIGQGAYFFKDHSYSESSNYFSSLKSSTTFRGARNGEEMSWTITPSAYSEDLITLLQIPSEENGYTLGIKINTFLGSPSVALDAILARYKSVTKKLVLDLRGNGGGYVSQASSMASLFVKKGTLLYRLVDKDGKTIEERKQTGDPTYTYDSLSLVIDGGSASASELFVLALRAGSNAKVYGLQSYGKGIAQNFKTFSDGSVLRYTTAYVYGPERENETLYNEGEDDDDVMCIQGKGITPDVPFSTNYYSYRHTYDYTSSIGVSEEAQKFFLSVLNEIDDASYPDNYSKDYHFSDAVKQYATELSTRYSDTSSTEAFQENGAMLKIVNDKFIKDTYDTYLKYEAELTKEVLA